MTVFNIAERFKSTPIAYTTLRAGSGQRAWHWSLTLAANADVAAHNQ
jgi:hypothetical protein